MKICTECSLEKPLERFSARGKDNPKPRSKCKDCCYSYQKTLPKPNINKDLAKIRRQKWEAKNPERRKEYYKTYYQENKEKISDNHRQKRSPDGEWYGTVLSYVNRRRAVKAMAEGHHTKQEWELLCLSFGNRCLKCGFEGPLTRDHIVPLSLGGTDWIENIQPLCKSCNSSKQAKIIDYRRV